MKMFLKNLKDLAFFIKPFWKLSKMLFMYNMISACIIVPLITYLRVTIVQRVVDTLIYGKGIYHIIFILIVYTGVQLIISTFQLCVNYYYNEKKIIDIKSKINYEIYKKALNTDYRFFDDPEFYNNFTWSAQNYANQVILSVNIFTGFLSNLTTIATLIGLMSTISPIIIIISFVYIFILTFIRNKINKENFNKNQEFIPIDRKMGYIHRAFYLNNLSADLKCTNISSFLFKDYFDSVKQHKEIIKKYAKKLSIPSIIADALGIICDNGVIFYIGYSIYSGAIPGIGAFTTMLNAYGNLSSRIRGLFQFRTDINNLGLYADKIRMYLTAQSLIENKTVNTKLSAPKGAISIDFSNVCFSYNNSNFKINNMNLSIKKGQKIGIVGENGAGKTTITKLLLRLYDPNAGEILINGHNINEYDVSEIRKIIGISFQNPNIYALSLSDNLQAYSVASEKKLLDNIQSVGLESILKKNKSTLMSQMTKEFSSDGIVLSGGEIQKLSIARLLTKEFGLLILDEPSSALDPIAEYEIMQMLLNQANKSTTIIIAHRLSTIRNVDKIFLFSEGRVAEEGTHEELMKLKGKYYEMFTKQAEKYIN